MRERRRRGRGCSKLAKKNDVIIEKPFTNKLKTKNCFTILQILLKAMKSNCERNKISKVQSDN